LQPGRSAATQESRILDLRYDLPLGLAGKSTDDKVNWLSFSQKSSALEEAFMFPGQPSHSMVRTAVHRAAHQIFDRPLILDDPIAVGLLPECSEQVIRSNPDEYDGPMQGLLRAVFAVRSRFAEDRLAAAAARGAGQYIIVGAGLDTFPWRQHPIAQSMRIFFIDHPPTLAWSLERFRERGLPMPSNVAFVAADLEARELGVRLDEHGFNQGTATFLSVLGVTQYITRDAVEALFGFAASLPAQSEIVSSFAPPDNELDSGELAGRNWGVTVTAPSGEPWLTRLSAPEVFGLLTKLGFGEVFHLSKKRLRERYFSDRNDTLKANGIDDLFAAVV
jgi:methyltransferase (TIGR00027 family)